MTTRWEDEEGWKKKKNIEHLIGPSLIASGWPITKWIKGQKYFGYNSGCTTNTNPRRPTHPRQHKRVVRTSGSDGESISSSSNSRSSSISRSGGGSRHSSFSVSSVNSDLSSGQKWDPQLLVGVGLVVAQDDRSRTTSGSSSPSDDYSLVQRGCDGKSKRYRKKQHLIYCEEIFDMYNNPNNTGGWPVCNHEVCHFYGSGCQYEESNYAMPELPVKTHRVAKPPPERQWIPVEDVSDQPKTATLTTMSYNILCDKYVSSNLYNFFPSWSLNWEYRKKLILQELEKHKPDIIALQEVETQQYWSYFKPKLESLGYAGSFLPRSRARTMSHEEKQWVDGCALFWKDDKFELDKEHAIEFTKLAIAKAERSEHMLNRVMTKDNVALAAVLRFRPRADAAGNAENDDDESNCDRLAGTPLLVCSTHIHWDPEYCDVKLIQAMMLTQELNSVLDQTAQEYDLERDEVPLLVCGDLNSTEESSVYEFLTTGSIEADHEDLKDFRGQTCLQKLNCSSSNFPDLCSHDLELISAYEIGTMPFTNYSLDYNGVIDHIFASPNLVCQSVLGPLDIDWLCDNDIATFPCPRVPSDHIPLVTQHALVLPQNPSYARTQDC